MKKLLSVVVALAFLASAVPAIAAEPTPAPQSATAGETQKPAKTAKKHSKKHSKKAEKSEKSEKPVEPAPAK